MENKDHNINITKLIIEPTPLLVEVFTTGLCNYSCDYCCYKNLRSKLFVNLEKLYSFIEILLSKTDKKIYLSFLGGEPTLHPNLLSFCKKLYKFHNNVKVNVYSNFSNDICLYNALLKLNAKLVLSWHSTKNDMLNKQFIANAKLLDKTYIHNIDIRVMYENFNEASIDAYLQLKEFLPLNCELELLSHKKNRKLNFTSTPQFYTPQQKALRKQMQETERNNMIFDTSFKFLNITYNDGNTVKYSLADIMFLDYGSLNVVKDDKAIALYGNRNYKNWYCYSGKYYMWIDDTGKIYPCFQYFLNKASCLGDINSDSISNFKLIGRICNYERCDQCFEVSKQRLTTIEKV